MRALLLRLPGYSRTRRSRRRSRLPRRGLRVATAGAGGDARDRGSLGGPAPAGSPLLEASPTPRSGSAPSRGPIGGRGDRRAARVGTGRGLRPGGGGLLAGTAAARRGVSGASAASPGRPIGLEESRRVGEVAARCAVRARRALTDIEIGSPRRGRARGCGRGTRISRASAPCCRARALLALTPSGRARSSRLVGVRARRRSGRRRPGLDLHARGIASGPSTARTWWIASRARARRSSPGEGIAVSWCPTAAPDASPPIHSSATGRGAAPRWERPARARRRGRRSPRAGRSRGSTTRRRPPGAARAPAGRRRGGGRPPPVAHQQPGGGLEGRQRAHGLGEPERSAQQDQQPARLRRAARLAARQAPGAQAGEAPAVEAPRPAAGRRSAHGAQPQVVQHRHRCGESGRRSAGGGARNSAHPVRLDHQRAAPRPLAGGLPAATASTTPPPAAVGTHRQGSPHPASTRASRRRASTACHERRARRRRGRSARPRAVVLEALEEPLEGPGRRRPGRAPRGRAAGSAPAPRPPSGRAAPRPPPPPACRGRSPGAPPARARAATSASSAAPRLEQRHQAGEAGDVDGDDHRTCSLTGRHSSAARRSTTPA